MLGSDEKISENLKKGVYEYIAYSDGYMPVYGEFSVLADSQFEIVLKKGTFVKSKIESHRMDIQEILCRGVDLENEDNYAKVQYSVELWFEETPIPVKTTLMETGFGQKNEIKVYNYDSPDKKELATIDFSECYGVKSSAYVLRAHGNATSFSTTITII